MLDFTSCLVFMFPEKIDILHLWIMLRSKPPFTILYFRDFPEFPRICRGFAQNFPGFASLPTLLDARNCRRRVRQLSPMGEKQTTQPTWTPMDTDGAGRNSVTRLMGDLYSGAP